MEDSDVQQQIKKRARRRLVGAVFFASIVAIVLPMVMDNEPKQAVQDVEIRIPGQDEKPFAPKFASGALEAPPDKAPDSAAEKAQEKKPEPAPEKPAVREPLAQPVAAPAPAVPAVAPTARLVEPLKEKKPQDTHAEGKPKAVEKAPEKPAAKPADKTPAKPEKPTEKKLEKPVEKKAEKAAEKPADKADKGDKADKDEAKRAAAILAGAGEAKPAKSEAAKPEAKSGPFLVLIGAYANEANAKNIQSKLGELGIKTYSEVLDTPQGKKTRVRAGPFPNREAAEKAREKMQRIGVPGMVSGK